jgi:hypothetical protein
MLNFGILREFGLEAKGVLVEMETVVETFEVLRDFIDRQENESAVRNLSNMVSSSLQNRLRWFEELVPVMAPPTATSGNTTKLNVDELLKSLAS